MKSAVNRAVIAPALIGRVVAEAYDLGTVTGSSLRAVGINDHYLVTTAQGIWVFRLYQYNKFWVMTESEHRFELEWLSHLHARGQPVSFPRPRKDRSLLGRLPAPEGRRFYALFSLAEGKRSFPPDAPESRRLGGGVAEIHLASDDFAPRSARIAYDAEFMVRAPVRRICDFLGNRRRDDQARLVEWGEGLSQALAQLPQTAGGYGIIGGDFNGTNHHVAKDGTLTFFDFDFCGHGWRAYDLAMFLWSMEHVGAGPEMWPAFLAGYQSRRTLDTRELESIPLFAAAIQIFMMGYHVTCIRWAGRSFLNDEYWNAGFNHLRALAEKAPATK